MGDNNWPGARVYWTPEQTEKLISLLEGKRVLWDANDPNHLNESKKEAALKAILDVLQHCQPDLTSEDILRKIRSLQSQFLKDIQAIEDSKSNCPDFVREPTLWCFDRLKFLISSEAEEKVQEDNTLTRSKHEIHWTQRKTLKLIELWKAKRELWDAKKPGYQDATIRKAAYKAIRDAMRKSVPNIKSRDIYMQITTLKEQMQSEFNSMQKEAGKRSKPSLWCFKLLQFLRPSMALGGGVSDQSRLNVKHVLPSSGTRKESCVKTHLKLRCRICFNLIGTETGSLTATAVDFLERELQFTYLTARNTRPDLPKHVCVKCQGDVDSFQRFYALCRKANEYLKLHTLKVKEEVEDVNVESDNEYLVNYDEVQTGNSAVFVADIQSSTRWKNGGTGMLMECPINSVNLELPGSEKEQEFLMSVNNDTNRNIKRETIIANVGCSELDTDRTTEAIVDIEKTGQTHMIKGVKNVTTIEYEKMQADDDEIVQNENSSEPLLVDISQAPETRKQYPCKFCEKSFKSFFMLRGHQRFHTDSRPYICHVCGKGFRQTSCLNTHLTQHFGKPVECELCGKRFARKSQMIVHNRKHRNERPFKCDFEGCSSAFFRNAQLRDHKLTHSGVRSHVCEFCSCRYAHHNALMHHIERVHPKVTYKCPECCKCIAQACRFRKHLETAHAIKLQDVSHLKITLTERAKRQRGMRKSLKAHQGSPDKEM